MWKVMKMQQMKKWKKERQKKKAKKKVKMKMKVCCAGCLTDDFDCCALKLIMN